MDPLIGGGIVLIWTVCLVIGVALSIFWIFELIDIVRRRFENDLIKVVWLVVVCCSHFVGAILYHFAGRQMGRLPGQSIY